MLQKVTYPDDEVGDRGYVTYAYNAQGQLVWSQDQSTNVLESVYDTSGRETARKVTTLASGFDGAVRCVERSYDPLGRVETVTQFSDLSSPTTATDGVKYSYDNWGNLERFEQDRNSAVGASGSVDDSEVSYAHAKASGGRVALRRSSMTLPSGKAITLTYSSFRGLFDDDASRVSSVADDSLTLANWIYNGVGQVVGTSYPEPNVASRLVDPNTAGNYPGLDRFNRMVNCYWQRDLTTPRKFYDISVSWDKNSNITLIDDAVHSGFDVQYTNDSINRLTKASEGTWSASAIKSKTREQEWTKLSHTGNWDREKLDLNGDGDYADTEEHDDTRVHNAVNEIDTQDLDSNSGTTGNNLTVDYDKNGNLTDDGKEYKYEWDAFNRLVKIRDRGDNALVEEFRYNGLGFRIGWHADFDSDGDVDSSDPWRYPVYDPAWRMLALYRGTETTPREEFVPQLAGNSGFGGSSLLDGAILRYRDTNGDGTLEEKRYYCQNFRGDVSALVTSGGALSEWVKYSPYGIPFGLPAGDTDSDGDCDATDAAQIQTWINTSAYDVRGDLDLDGDVDTTDKSTAEAPGTVTRGWRVLSSTSVSNRRGYAGYERDASLDSMWHCRFRALDSNAGRWLSRDLLRVLDSSLYRALSSSPLTRVDPLGLQDQGTLPSALEGMDLDKLHDQALVDVMKLIDLQQSPEKQAGLLEEMKKNPDAEKKIIEAAMAGIILLKEFVPPVPPGTATGSGGTAGGESGGPSGASVASRSDLSKRCNSCYEQFWKPKALEAEDFFAKARKALGRPGRGPGAADPPFDDDPAYDAVKSKYNNAMAGANRDYCRCLEILITLGYPCDPCIVTRSSASGSLSGVARSSASHLAISEVVSAH
ncbi:MAG: hypothetical protein JNJ88_04180 [Planctomycetes bacterium]|nr:hypothetical protein [Planctomycetota bacterium]